MRIKSTNLNGVKLILPEVFEDHRGQYVEIYNKDLFIENGIKVNFIQDDISISSNKVLRGIHSDNTSWKLVSCLRGRFYLVVVNCDEESEGFGSWVSFTLSDLNKSQVLIPPKHGVAHLALSDEIIFHYKQSENYDRARQSTYKFNDTRFNIWWPVSDPILSMRDEIGEYVD